MNPGYVFEECARNLELWDSSACVRLGAYDRRAEEGIWDSITCATVDIKIPADVTSAEGNAQSREQPPVDIGALDEAQGK